MRPHESCWEWKLLWIGPPCTLGPASHEHFDLLSLMFRDASTQKISLVFLVCLVCLRKDDIWPQTQDLLVKNWDHIQTDLTFKKQSLKWLGTDITGRHIMPLMLSTMLRNEDTMALFSQIVGEAWRVPASASAELASSSLTPLEETLLLQKRFTTYNRQLSNTCRYLQY